MVGITMVLPWRYYGVARELHRYKVAIMSL